MTDFTAESVLAGLKGFQHNAVDHVIDRFYGDGAASGTGRFLVADETGLGKSIVARGVVARAIEQLQHDDDIDRIDIVYICSNQDLAAQNLRRLNVTGDDHISMATRLTLLARESARLNQASTNTGKKVNLVSFTPGTSFTAGGWRTGSVDERAMLVLILDRLVNSTPSERRSTRVLLQGAVRTLPRFSWRVDQLAAELERLHGPDERIVATFQSIINRGGLLTEFLELRDEVKGRQALPGPIWHRTMELIARLRQSLAKASVDALEPDIVILDEFQRFRHLLDPAHSEAAELADSLFSHGQAKVLLLSATPYKPYTTRGDTEDDHARDFLETIRFLAGRDESVVLAVQDAFRAHRASLIAGDAGTETAARVRELLLPLMSRSERPRLAVGGDMVVERPLDGGPPRAEEIAGWSALETLGRHLGARIQLEHWKSIPYFATFMESYKPGSRTRELLDADGGQAIAPLLAATAGVERAAVEERRHIDMGNGMLRALAADTLDRGWWKLLWMPATMPYLEPGPIYSSVGDDVTKHVVFSAWSGVPTAVSALLSHEAERLAVDLQTQGEEHGAGAGDTSRRLSWAVVDGVASRMSTLALFWPHPVLAERADPLEHARANNRQVPAGAVAQLPAGPDEADSGEAWAAFFSTAGRQPEDIDAATVATQAAHAPGVDSDELHDGGNFATYMRRAGEAAAQNPSHHPDLGRLAAHSPGSIAYRAVRSVASEAATDAGIWTAAWRLSLALRSLFDRPASTALLDNLYRGTELAYWRMILEYCADGNLQATLDEYLFQIKSEFGGHPLGDAELSDAADVAASAIRLMTASLRGHDTTAERAPITFRTRFAVRYGSAHNDADEKVAARQADVRTAFNSPFAPFVLASTSVGQEGIDFHWWSHAVVHWNLPSNPVDFEQREGRVHRFMGHAVRKNVAAQHWPDVLAAKSGAWDAAFSAAEDACAEPNAAATKLGEFAPWWVYPGPHRIHRRVASFTLSRDHARYSRLVDALTLYRLTLGQPRQEDMLRLLEQRQLDAGAVAAIDLRPPRASAPRAGSTLPSTLRE